jgi:hypothetical protein
MSGTAVQMLPSLCAHQCMRSCRCRLSATMAPTNAASPPGHTISSAVPAHTTPNHCDYDAHGHADSHGSRVTTSGLSWELQTCGCSSVHADKLLHISSAKCCSAPRWAVWGFRPACSMVSKNGGLVIQKVKRSPGRIAGRSTPLGKALPPAGAVVVSAGCCRWLSACCWPGVAVPLATPSAGAESAAAGSCCFCSEDTSGIASLAAAAAVLCSLTSRTYGRICHVFANEAGWG